MGQPYVGEIRMLAGNFPPVGWKFCNGELLSKAEYETLYNLLGTTYGGDGQTTFALPDLRGRLPIHQGGGFSLGQAGGEEMVALTTSQMPSHSHGLQASNDIPVMSSPGGNVTGQAGTAKFYRAGDPTVALCPAAVSTQGGSGHHTNLQPFLCINFIISLYGQIPVQG